MFKIPEIDQRIPMFVGLGRPPITLDLDAARTPTTPEARAALAATLAAETLGALLAATRAQRGLEPVMVIASVDCGLGRMLIERRFGYELAASLCGPVVLAFSEAELAALFGGGIWKQLVAVFEKIGVEGGGVRVLFAVNAANILQVDPRVLRAVAAPSAAESAAPASDEGPADTWQAEPLGADRTVTVAAPAPASSYEGRL